MAVNAIDFFNHMDSFLDYRKTSYVQVVLRNRTKSSKSG